MPDALYLDRTEHLGVKMMERFQRDWRSAVQRLWATPRFTIFAIVSLAVGLGSTTAIYSVLYPLLWKPLGMAEESRVLDVTQAGRAVGAMSWSDFQDLRAAQTSFSG